jgi:hypothetical protein
MEVARQPSETRASASMPGRRHQRTRRKKADISLHLPIAILAELSPTSGDRVVGLYGRPLTAINQARLANSSLKPDLIKVIAKDTATKIETLSTSIADDFRIAPERVASKDVTVALEHAEGRVRDWQETAVSTLNRSGRIFAAADSRPKT